MEWASRASKTNPARRSHHQRPSDLHREHNRRALDLGKVKASLASKLRGRDTTAMAASPFWGYAEAMGPAKILIIDDDERIQSEFGELLRKNGFAVAAAASAAAGIKALSEDAYNLALLDVHLGDENGIQVLKRMGAEHKQVPVVMVSGIATIDIAIEAIRLGASDFLEKPVSNERLLITVRNALRLTAAEATVKEWRSASGQFEELLGSSPAICALRDLVKRVARSECGVLLQGERGTGKGLVARTIHEQSRRADKPFVAVNCAAIPEGLVESELFGHEKGAFTGAISRRIGVFEQADGGTIFLDEIGSMAPFAQSKVLKVLQERAMSRLGGRGAITVDVRVIAASNKDLAGEAAAGRFRADLYDRLNMFPIITPPLRGRADDIREFTLRFIECAVKTNDWRATRITPPALDALARHSWPGNVRDLRNMVERLVILNDGLIDEDSVQRCLHPEVWDESGSAPPPTAAYRPGITYRELCDDFQRRLLVEALEYHKGNKAETARRLKFDRAHFFEKLAKLGIGG